MSGWQGAGGSVPITSHPAAREFREVSGSILSLPSVGQLGTAQRRPGPAGSCGGCPAPAVPAPTCRALDPPLHSSGCPCWTCCSMLLPFWYWGAHNGPSPPGWYSQCCSERESPSPHPTECPLASTAQHVLVVLGDTGRSTSLPGAKPCRQQKCFFLLIQCSAPAWVPSPVLHILREKAGRQGLSL